MDDIGALATSCARCFDTLTQSLRTSSDELQKQMMPIAIENVYAPFKIWAGSLGALRRGRSSLDALGYETRRRCEQLSSTFCHSCRTP
jgi:hypothetical protein